MEIRSYRAVFDLERRIYRVEGLRLNPGGIPVRGVLYCLALLAGLALLGALPLLGAAVRALPWYLRDLVLPAGGAGVLTVIRVEGRPFHLASAALLRHTLGPRHYAGARPCRAAFAWGGCGAQDAPSASGGCWRPGDLLVLPDGSDARLRRLRYTGPGAVVVRAAHERAIPRSPVLSRLAHRPHLTVHEPRGRRKPAADQVIALQRGARLLVR
jgi:hypothetical protein